MDVDTSLSQQSPRRVQTQPPLVAGTPVPHGCHPMLCSPSNAGAVHPTPRTKTFAVVSQDMIISRILSL